MRQLSEDQRTAAESLGCLLMLVALFAFWLAVACLVAVAWR